MLGWGLVPGGPDARSPDAGGGGLSAILLEETSLWFQPRPSLSRPTAPDIGRDVSNYKTPRRKPGQ